VFLHDTRLDTLSRPATSRPGLTTPAGPRENFFVPPDTLRGGGGIDTAVLGGARTDYRASRETDGALMVTDLCAEP
jgi:hypothetical protein